MKAKRGRPTSIDLVAQLIERQQVQRMDSKSMAEKLGVSYPTLRRHIITAINAGLLEHRLCPTTKAIKRHQR